MSLYDRVKVGVSGTPGTGPITLGTAALGYRSFTDAAVPDGTSISYVIEDGGAWEVGHGTYTAGVLARDGIIASSIGGSPVGAISPSSAATVYIAVLANDLHAGGIEGGTVNITPPTMVQTTSQEASTGTFTLASAPTVGNLLVAILYGPLNMVAAAGWNSLGSTAGTNGNDEFRVVTRKVVAGDTASLVPVNSSPDVSGALYEISGYDPASVTGAVVTFGTRGGGPFTETLTTINSGELIIGLAASYSSQPTIAAVTGLVADGYVFASGPYHSGLQGFHKPQPAPGTVSLSATMPGAVGPGGGFNSGIFTTVETKAPSGSGSGSGGSGGRTISARAMRIDMPPGSGYYAYAFQQIDLLDASGAIIPYPTSGVTATASSTAAGSSATGPFDTDTSSYWASDAGGGPPMTVATHQTLQVDFGTQITGIAAIGITSRGSGAGAQMPVFFDIKFCPDATKAFVGFAFGGDTFGDDEHRVFKLPGTY